MLCSSDRYEGLRWRAWPCSQCNSGLTPIGVIIRGSESNPGIQGDTPEQLSAFQIGLLQDWVGKCNHNPAQLLDLPQIDEGSEHAVFFSASDSMVFKATRPQIYGDSYYLVNGIVNQRNCSPLEYLIRLHLWAKLFRSAPIDLGITEGGQIISIQKFIKGKPPKQETVDQFLNDSGLTAIKKNCWLWKKAYSEFEIWIGDARDENFVETEAGIVPIDIRIWFA